jgi:enoyl-CoA hydratase/carnithine racemase
MKNQLPQLGFNMAIEILFKNSYAEIVIKRPPANAYELTFMTEFNLALDKLETYKKTGIVLIRSEIEKFFCAGADLKIFGENTIKQNNKMVALARKVTHRIEKSDKVFIAAINGHCLGGGLELSLACDLRIAKSGNYQIGMPEINIGLIPGNGGTQRLLRVVGQSNALEMLLSRKNINPEQALAKGLIHEIIDSDNWETEMHAYAENLALGPQLAMTATKKAIKKGATLSLKEGLKLEKKTSKTIRKVIRLPRGYSGFCRKKKTDF